MWWHTPGTHATPLRAREHRLAKIHPSGRLRWCDPAAYAPYGPPLALDALDFTAAPARTAMLRPGATLAPRSQWAALQTAGAALSYLEVAPAAGRLSVSPDVGQAKDFIRAWLTGMIAAALAYPDMQALGYRWAGHWEDCAAAPSWSPRIRISSSPSPPRCAWSMPRARSVTRTRRPRMAGVRRSCRIWARRYAAAAPQPRDA
ncbi:hypothetical protein [Cupriavidus basilensis]|uniref:hypothetical protein n=1 Tax=Cupriavidus basilensis TaxID=68895 RepID=UPI000750F436|nr:hypothetical protein [Cupriavidus basilensis]